MTGYEMLKAALYNSLGIGHKNAKTRRQLRETLKCNDRVLRDAIEYLRHTYTILTRDDGKGYYLPETNDKGRAEAVQWIQRQHRRAESINESTRGALKFISGGIDD